MIDYHSHLLPALDDGAPSLDEALAMARVLAGAGVRTVHCTPHRIRGIYPTEPGQVRRAVAELQAALDAEGIDLALRPGMEYHLDEFFPEDLDRVLPLGDSRLLLVEAPGQARPEQIRENLFLALRRGFTPLIAHPERHAWWAPAAQHPGLWQRLFSPSHPAPAAGPSDFPTLAELRAQGCRLQGNLGSLAGFYGPDVRRRALVLLRAGHFSYFGSDAHRLQGLERIVRHGRATISKEAG